MGRKKSNKKINKFLGFPEDLRNKKFWMYPKVMDGFWCQLNGSEQKVLDFILRQTLGFDKLSDEISLSQFEHGIRNLSEGTGLSKRPIVNALKNLELKNFVKIKKVKGETNEYRLVVQKVNSSGVESKQGVGAKGKQGARLKSKHTINNNTINNTIIEIFKFYKKHICSGFNFSSDVKKSIEQRFKVYSQEDLQNAMINFSKNDWRMRNNANLGPGWFFKSDNQIEKFLKLEAFDDLREERDEKENTKKLKRIVEYAKKRKKEAEERRKQDC